MLMSATTTYANYIHDNNNDRPRQTMVVPMTATTPVTTTAPVMTTTPTTMTMIRVTTKVTMTWAFAMATTT